LATANAFEQGLAVANRGMESELSDDIETALEFDPNKEVQDRHIVEVFVDSDRPYLSRKQVQQEIDLSSQGTRGRLEALEEQGVLDSDVAGGGRLYWIADERSGWPIPPDVDVEPTRDEETVTEFVSRFPVQVTGLGLALMLLGAVLTTLFTLALAYEVTVPVVGTSQLLVWAIGAVFVGIAFCVGGMATWILNRARN
jgi:hypothetical protein